MGSRKQRATAKQLDDKSADRPPGPREAPIAMVQRIKLAFSLRRNFESIYRRPGMREAPVDGLRALSMFWVMATHVFLALSVYVDYPSYHHFVKSLPPYVAWVFHGEKALDTFFVISGFLIGGLLIGEHDKKGTIDIKRFYTRRYLRLTPAYAAALLIVLASGAEPAAKTPFIWTNILYVNNFLSCGHMFMDWTWSLAVEEQFYLVLPLFLVLLFFRSKHKVAVLLLVFLASFGVNQYVLALHPHITSTSFAHHFFRNSPEFTCEYFESVYDNLYTRFGPFVLGVLAAYFHICHGEKLKRAIGSRALVNDGLVCGAVAVCIALISAPIYDPDAHLGQAFLNAYAVANRNVWGIAVTVAMLACLYPVGPISRAAGRLLSARVWYPVAQLSYCTYLFHLGFVVLSYLIVTRIFQPGIEPKQALSFFGLPELGLTFVLTVVFSFAFGTIIYLLVERPFINLRR